MLIGIERLENNADWYGDYRCSANDIAIRTYEIIEKVNYVTSELIEIKKDKGIKDIVTKERFNSVKYEVE